MTTTAISVSDGDRNGEDRDSGLSGDSHASAVTEGQTPIPPSPSPDTDRAGLIEQIIAACDRNPLLVGFAHGEPTRRELQDRLDLVRSLAAEALQSDQAEIEKPTKLMEQYKELSRVHFINKTVVERELDAAIARAEAAEADRDALMKAAGFRPRALEGRDDIVLIDIAGLRPAMVEARKQASEYRSEADDLRCTLTDEIQGSTLLLRVWRSARKAEARALAAESTLQAKEAQIERVESAALPGDLTAAISLFDQTTRAHLRDCWIRSSDPEEMIDARYKAMKTAHEELQRALNRWTGRHATEFRAAALANTEHKGDGHE